MHGSSNMLKLPEGWMGISHWVFHISAGEETTSKCPCYVLRLSKGSMLSKNNCWRQQGARLASRMDGWPRHWVGP